MTPAILLAIKAAVGIAGFSAVELAFLGRAKKVVLTGLQVRKVVGHVLDGIGVELTDEQKAELNKRTNYSRMSFSSGGFD